MTINMWNTQIWMPQLKINIITNYFQLSLKKLVLYMDYIKILTQYYSKNITQN